MGIKKGISVGLGTLTKGFKSPKSYSKILVPKIKIAVKKKNMEQFLGLRTTAHANMEGRLKVANAKRKFAKVAIKTAKKPKAKKGSNFMF